MTAAGLTLSEKRERIFQDLKDYASPYGPLTWTALRSIPSNRDENNTIDDSIALLDQETLPRSKKERPKCPIGDAGSAYGSREMQEYGEAMSKYLSQWIEIDNLQSWILGEALANYIGTKIK